MTAAVLVWDLVRGVALVAGPVIVVLGLLRLAYHLTAEDRPCR